MLMLLVNAQEQEMTYFTLPFRRERLTGNDRQHDPYNSIERVRHWTWNQESDKKGSNSMQGRITP